MMVQKWKVEQIKVGQRTRKRVTELGPLAESIKNVGLLSPIVIDDGGHLLAGQRRLEAVRYLGWVEVPCTVVSLPDESTPLQIEHDENVCRVEFKPSELREINFRLYEIEKRKAKERQAKNVLNLNGSPSSGPGPELGNGQTRDRVGSALGIGGKTSQRLFELHEAIEESPELHGDLDKVMDTKGVKAAHKELQKRQGKKKNKVKPTKSVIKDQLGIEVPDHLRDAFGDLELSALIERIETWRDGSQLSYWKSLGQKLYEHYPYIRVGDMLDHVTNAMEQIQYAADALSCGRPYAICPACNGCQGGCRTCRQSGWVPEWRYQEISK